MPLEDFFQRQIDELGKVLGMLLTRLSGLKIEGEFGESLNIVKQTLNSDSTLNFGEVSGVAADELFDYMNSKKINPENYEKLAELFYELADGLEDNDPEIAIDYFKKSLLIHEYLNQHGTVYSFERQYKIDEIKGIIKEYNQDQ